LIPFHAQSPNWSVSAELEPFDDESWIRCIFRIENTGTNPLHWPERQAQLQRRDRLFEDTCFELFVTGPGERYAEFNFSPSGEWCDFVFDAYRQQSKIFPVQRLPIFGEISTKTLPNLHELTVTIDLSSYAGFLEIGVPMQNRFGISAVVKAQNGEKSFWALAHKSERPDFHRRESFVGVFEPFTANGGNRCSHF